MIMVPAAAATRGKGIGNRAAATATATATAAAEREVVPPRKDAKRFMSLGLGPGIEAADQSDRSGAAISGAGEPLLHASLEFAFRRTARHDAKRGDERGECFRILRRTNRHRHLQTRA
ncbi:hypothetical protein GCM10007925_23080 [Sphingomonas astaxanthinifaciens DSM 22298]|uniref:Uncharacterized protein n=1 Tax=Sphingomonas astaxanthinifaciens DSM 22298 TaxID=1123267 RepID=A0ABQ5ZAG9_9SPHN|nr:hypothetical protein GCM10007925_23080 [Sphingomonas astaxanthinifaciens DSM 22298]